MSSLCLFVIINLFTFAVSVCPAGWARRDSNCYYIFEDKLNRSEAFSLCSVHSAGLVSFVDQNEWNYISSLVKSVQLDTDLWTGLTYGSNKKWMWDDSTNYTELYSWQVSANDPGTGGTTSGPGQHYVPDPDPQHAQAKITFDGSDTYLTVDVSSSLLHPFCKRDIDSRDLCDTNDDWVKIDHGCYKAYPQASWADAVSTCSNGGGELLSASSQNDLSPVTLLTSVDTNVWVGVSYKVSTGYFYYADGNRRTTYLPWLKSGYNYSDPGKSCVAAQHTTSYPGYFMSSCYEELRFICRRPIGICPLGWYQDGIECFKLHIRPEEKMSWFMAVDYCQRQGAHMVEHMNTQEAAVILNQALQENDNYVAWLGFSGTNMHYNYLPDLNNAAVMDNFVLFNTTTFKEGPFRCGVTDFSPGRSLYPVVYCFTPHPFVCSISLTASLTEPPPPVVSCDEDWILFNNECYKLVKNRMTYDDAVRECIVDNQADIAAINDTMHQSFFSTSTFMSSGLEYYWIGVKYDNIDGRYVLEGTNQEAPFWNFDPDQMYNATDDQCIYVNTGSTAPFTGSWTRDSCLSEHYFVCQKPGRPVKTSPTIQSNAWSSRCGVGWIFNNKTNLCYFISPYVKKPWREAYTECRRYYQADLLSVYGEEEQLYIEGLLKSDQYKSLEEPLWIGAGDMWTNHGWGWADGQPFKYMHWGDGQPAYIGDVDGDNCGYIPVAKNYEWEARRCGDELGFICKKKAAPEKGHEEVTPPTVASTCQSQSLISGEYSIQFPSGFSASSSQDPWHRPEQSRMVPWNNASWSPEDYSTKEWLAVTFPRPVSITDLQLRGEDSVDQYVSKFKLQYQYDDLSPWYWVTDKSGAVQEYDGVTTPDSSSSIFLIGEIQARSLKIWPVDWSYGISIQWELMGCPEDPCQPELGMSGPLIIDDAQISASSQRIGFETFNVRLAPVQTNQQLTAWVPDQSDSSPWIQVDLGKIRIVRGIRLQRGMGQNYITKFQLMFSQMPGNDLSNFITYTEPYHAKHVFDGIKDRSQFVDVYMKASVEARVVRILPIAWNNEPAMKFDVLVCSAGCSADPMIADLPISSLSASDFADTYEPSRSVLNTQRDGDKPDAWKPKQANYIDNKSYLQVDLGTVKQVVAVATQGSESESSWVTSYYLAFSTDGISFYRHGANVTYYTSDGQPHTMYNDTVLYKGNFDGFTIVKNELPQPINARYVQFWPHEFHLAIAVRWEVYACSQHTATTSIGCYADDPNDPDLPFVPLEDKYASMWPEACVSHCYDKGYRYAGLENGDRCSCGNAYGLYGTANNCTMSCQSPYTNFTCGGLNQNLIYSTGISANDLICPAGWSPYKDSCYAVIDKDTWLGARDACRKMGADLVDIADQGENDFVASMFAQESSSAWIGFNDIMSTLSFEWSTGAEVLYTNWGFRQPIVNPGLEQHSVLIFGDGSWSNTFSESVNTYICETVKKPSSDAAGQTQDQGCPMGWKAFSQSCYQFNRQKNDWQRAKALCQSNNATLARIESSQENTDLASALSLLDGNYWIDVHDGNSTGLYWHDPGSPDLSYANWANLNPASVGGCVSVGTAQATGQWVLNPCSNKNRFICEQPRANAPTSRPTAPTQPQPSCLLGWEQHGNGLCYQFNTNASTPRLSWHEASQNCIDQGANLASFHNDVEFDAVVAKLMNQSIGNFWIGLHNFDTSTGFQWSDGSVMNFVRWGVGQPNTFQPLTVCGELFTDTLTMGLQYCSRQRNWICSIAPGKPVTYISPEIFPMPDPIGACKPLPDTWRRYKDYCYYVTNGEAGTEEAKTWREAREFCGMQGADLASINSADENRFLEGTLRASMLPEDGVWIGLNELDRNSGYSWSDGSPLGMWQINWNVNEPNDYNGEEACVEMLTRNGKWNDKHCALRQGFVCKQPAPDANITRPVPVPRPDGNCPSGFTQFGKKCYQVMGVVGLHTRLSWNNARTSCKNMLANKYSNYSVDLASITSPEENAFVVTLLNEYRVSAWIGMRRLNSGQYVWADNEDLTFESWNKDEPNMPPGNDSCVYMYGPDSVAGKWNDVACEEEAPYVCQGFVDPSMPSIIVPPSPQCAYQLGFQQFGKSCYQLFNDSQSFEAAEAHCARFAGHLASIMDSYDWAEVFLLGSSFVEGVWIGLWDAQNLGTFTWQSGYPVKYTRWAHHQPVDTPGWGGCVYMDQRGLFVNGNCFDNRAFVCRADAAPPQEIPISPGGYCSDSAFTLHGATCYLLVMDTQVNYDTARLNCLNRGATLASVHNRSLTLNIPWGQAAWIGLAESIDEGFSWEDGSALAITNWADGKPNWSGIGEAEEACVVMQSDATWSNVNCENTYGYICAVPAEAPTSQLTLPAINVTQGQPTFVTKPTPTPFAQKSPPSPTGSKNPTRKPSTSNPGLSTSSTSKPSQVTQFRFTSTATSTVAVALPSSSSQGLSGGATAGIVISVLILVTAAIIGVFIVLRRRGRLRASFLRREASRTKNFENSLYQETRKDTLTKVQDPEGVNIIPMTSGKYSVSYSREVASEGQGNDDDSTFT